MLTRLATGALALALIACSAEEPSEQDRSVWLYALDCGRIEMLDLGLFDRGGAFAGRQNSAVNSCFLIRHPDGDLLWDTGLPDALHSEEPLEVPGFRISMPVTLKGQLEELGLAPSDIDYLALSHSHFDHTGNANEFAGAMFLIHEEERRYMFSDDARANSQGFSSYSALESARTTTFTDEHDVFGDGSVRIIATPGHTPGHSVLLVTLKEAGPILLTGDLYHLTEARERRTVPVFNTDPEETLRSMERFEALAAATGARVIIQHEPKDIDALPRSPAFLR
jgi:N-acyl homoserine lactone hydrolase